MIITADEARALSNQKYAKVFALIEERAKNGSHEALVFSRAKEDADPGFKKYFKSLGYVVESNYFWEGVDRYYGEEPHKEWDVKIKW